MQGQQESIQAPLKRVYLARQLKIFTLNWKGFLSVAE
jgi:hypothetical protein